MIEDLWYKNTVIYSLDLETFMDANGDGVGDFEGLMRRVEYLHALGVGAIWLSPFQPTPNRDNGYDISDFYGVDPRHGSSGDFVEFMHQAQKRGMQVIMDLVVNHTSDQHLWFQAARSDKNSPYRDWYVWSKKRPSDWKSGMVFPGVQHSTWTYDKESREYYFHRFYHFQPDLNMDNPAVRTEIRRIMGYWIELGVVGFRVDAVPFIIETPAPGKKKPQLKFDYLHEMRKFLQWRCGHGVLLGEANVLPKETLDYFGGEDDGIHMMFNFFVNQHLFYALATAEVAPLVEALRVTKKIPLTAQWAQFLRNHDELDLGRLSEDQREKIFARFGPEPEMQLYHRGIRRRLVPMLGNQRHVELAYSMLFSLPGTPVIRYGDEIGMGDDLSLNERDAVRTPMQWANEPQAGFSTCSKLVYPVISKGPYSHDEINVEAQRRDPSSLLNWTASMIRLRKECPEIGWGDWEILKTGSPSVLAMRYDWRGNSVVVVHNFDEKPHEIRIRPGVQGAERLVNLLVKDQSEADESGTHRISLEAYGYRWYRVGSLSHILKRTKE
ncbi:MAG: alpha-amylase family protein [Candidatus Binatia bacterium]